MEKLKNLIFDIKEYYPKYLLAHQNINNRRMHVLGQAFTLFYIVLALKLVGINLLFMPLTILIPFVIYPFAWFGHIYFERNKPATWNTNPMYTKTCDLIMLADILTGKISIVK